MSRRLHYFALEFVNGEMVRRHEFACAVDAEEGARIIAKLASGALAFQQWCDEAMGDYDTAEPLLALGQVPHSAWSEMPAIKAEAA